MCACVCVTWSVRERAWNVSLTPSLLKTGRRWGRVKPSSHLSRDGKESWWVRGGGGACRDSVTV